MSASNKLLLLLLFPYRELPVFALVHATIYSWIFCSHYAMISIPLFDFQLLLLLMISHIYCQLLLIERIPHRYCFQHHRLFLLLKDNVMVKLWQRRHLLQLWWWLWMEMMMMDNPLTIYQYNGAVSHPSSHKHGSFGALWRDEEKGYFCHSL